MKAFETNLGPKQEVRNLICSHSENIIPNVKKIFTLPSKEALCYYTFKERFPKANISCIERDESIARILWDKDIECQVTTIKDYAKSKVTLERHHDIVFLDYYSFLSAGILDEIKTFVTNDNIIHPNKDVIVGITLMKAMRRDGEKTLDLLSDYRYKGYRSGTDNEVSQVASGILGFLDIECYLRDVELLESLEYKASKNSTSMYFLLLKIVK